MDHVFLLGDSIRMGNETLSGYEPFLRDLARGRWLCHSPADNCRFAQYALRYAHQWAAACPAEDVSLVIFRTVKSAIQKIPENTDEYFPFGKYT